MTEQYEISIHLLRKVLVSVKLRLIIIHLIILCSHL